MSKLNIGWSEISITPDKKISLAGQFAERISEYVEKPCTVTAMAVEAGGEKAVLLALDHCGMCREVALDFTTSISEATGLPAEAILLHCTHTHTAPPLLDPEMPESLNGDFTSVDPKKKKSKLATQKC